ncbi:MAG: hypothetical protein R3266_11870, partial [Gemmatimonadota bacterium]|nr:hypothetical protein [Gemmatimonadota bacterium]
MDHARREAGAEVDRVLADDPELGEARATRGIILTFLEWDHPAAERELWRATELSPGYATAHQWYGQFLSAHGDGARGLGELDLALDLDPLSPAVNEGRGLALYHLDRTDEAVSQLRTTLDLDPRFWRARLGLALCHAADGDLRAATDELVLLWSAGGYGGTVVEAEEAEKRLARDVYDALEHLLDCTRTRIGKVSVIRVVEVILLMLLARHDEAVGSLEAAYDDRSLACVATMYAPVLD